MADATIDLNGRYRVEGWSGIAVYIRGYVTTKDECQGHYDDDLALDTCGLGEGYYCDGECEEPYDDTSQVRVVMVGDDREHIVGTDELIPLDELDYCHECGQIGCGHDGLDRS